MTRLLIETQHSAFEQLRLRRLLIENKHSVFNQVRLRRPMMNDKHHMATSSWGQLAGILVLMAPDPYWQIHYNEVCPAGCPWGLRWYICIIRGVAYNMSILKLVGRTRAQVGLQYQWDCCNKYSTEDLATKCGVVDRVRCKPPLAKQDIVEVPMEIWHY